MAKIALVTDSTTNIPKELSKGHDIHVVPSVIIWGAETLRDGVDIQPDEFYKRLATSKEKPTTSQPTPAAFKEKFEELGGSGFTDIVCSFVSSKFSGTLTSAEQAKGMVTGVNIHIIDGRSASLGTGWPLLEAAKAIKAGKSAEDCVKIIESALTHTGVMLYVDTLEYLHRGGRIGGASRFMGTALSVKPILEVQDGALEATERVRTKSKALERIVELLAERVAGRTPLHLGVLHANAAEDAKALMAEASKRLSPAESTLTEVSPAVGVHIGPGVVGFAFMAGYK
ncbi:MAG TPA: DegV family protein [Anaerolineales bacterium]|nr:DegV family protein [Anaerolineales bacterium]